jgi:hypothetical protein
MEQRPSWEIDSRLDGQKILDFYGTRRFTLVFNKSPPGEPHRPYCKCHFKVKASNIRLKTWSLWTWQWTYNYIMWRILWPGDLRYSEPVTIFDTAIPKIWQVWVTDLGLLLYVTRRCFELRSMAGIGVTPDGTIFIPSLIAFPPLFQNLLEWWDRHSDRYGCFM